MADPPQLRSGRPWGPLRGETKQINELAALLRNWLDQAGIPVRELHAQLTPDHFSVNGKASQVPKSPRTLYDPLAGKGLSWELASAVIDVCTSDYATQQAREQRARQLWDQAQHTPTALAEQERANQELLAAKDQIIALQAAHQKSEQARSDAQWLVGFLFQMLQQMRTAIDGLQLRHEELREDPGHSHHAEVEVVQRQLQHAKTEHQETRQQLRRAEHERDKAHLAATRAARLLRQKERELARLRAAHDPHEESPPKAPDTDEADTPPVVGEDGDAFFEDYSLALDKVRNVLDQSEETLDAVREEIDSLDQNTSVPPTSPNTDHTATADDTDEHDRPSAPGPRLSRTTVDNSATSTSSSQTAGGNDATSPDKNADAPATPRPQPAPDDPDRPTAPLSESGLETTTSPAQSRLAGMEEVVKGLGVVAAKTLLVIAVVVVLGLAITVGLVDPILHSDSGEIRADWHSAGSRPMQITAPESKNRDSRHRALAYRLSSGQPISSTFTLPRLERMWFLNSTQYYLSADLDFQPDKACGSDTRLAWQLQNAANNGPPHKGRLSPTHEVVFTDLPVPTDTLTLTARLDAPAPCTASLRLILPRIENYDPGGGRAPELPSEQTKSK